MARRKFNDGQEIVFQDFNKMGQTIEQELYERVIFELVQRGEDAFFDDSFLVNYASPTSVTVNAGSGFQTDATQVAPESKKRLLYRASAPTINLTAPHASLDRIDLVVCKAARADGASETRKYKSPLGAISNESLVTSDDWEAEIITVDGTAAGSPVAPAVPAGYIKLAECYVSAVSGMSGSGDVTDFRTLMPVGGAATINSLTAVRVTADAALAIQQAILELDTLAKYGLLDYNDFTDQVSDPAVPAAGKMRVYNKGGVLYSRDTVNGIAPLGSGAGGGSGAEWHGDALEEYDAVNEKVKKFVQGDTQKETLWLKIPQGYLSGRQILMYLNFYSPGSSNQFKFQVVSTLIRKNLDAVTSVANQRTVDSGDITNTVANQDRQLSFQVTSATGTINSVAATAGDRIKVELTRIAPSGSEDTNDVSMVPGSTEVKFG
jgi:hypothetical protein